MKRQDFALAFVLVAVLTVLGVAILGLVGALIVKGQESPVVEVGDGLRKLDCPEDIELWACLQFAHLEAE